MDTWSTKQYWRKAKKDKTPMEAWEYRNLAERFSRLFTSVFEWKGLPDGVDPYLIERYAFEDGKAIVWFFKDKSNPVVTRASESAWDINGKPKKFRPRFDYKPEGIDFPDELDINECVPIYDSQNWNIKRSDVLFKIVDIVDTNETIRTQIGNQRMPLVAICGNAMDKEKKKYAVRDIFNGAKALFMDSDITESIKVFNTGAPLNIETLNAWRNVLINEILEQGGIDSQDAFMKKERKLVDEIEGNDEILNYYLTDCLRARQTAARRLSDFLGTEVTVSVQKVIRPMMRADGSIGGGEDDGNSDKNEN